MSGSRSALRSDVAGVLGERRLIWAGIRGGDAESLADLPQFDASFTIIDRYRGRPLHVSVAYEELSGVRVDLETWDLDDHLGEPTAAEFRKGLLRAMSVPCALLPYRPSQFLSALAFARHDRCLNLGMFGAQQSAFEHKPWVESSLASRGIRTLDWQYVADEEQLDAQRLLGDGPVMVRRSRTSGGEGLVKVSTAGELSAAWPRHAEAFASVSRYVPGALPVNVGATVWTDGVTVHLPSVQLIGLPECVSRPFGYCGNDFGAARDLDAEQIDALETTTVEVGRWLGEQGYRGTFGVDFLVTDGLPLFTEVNPRFQGSTRPSALLAVEADEPCLLLEHIAAVMGLPCPSRDPLRERVRRHGDIAQVVVHNTTSVSIAVDMEGLRAAVRRVDPSVRVDADLPDGVACEPGATLARFTLRSRVTTGGYDLRPDVSAAVRRWADSSVGHDDEGSARHAAQLPSQPR